MGCMVQNEIVQTRLRYFSYQHRKEPCADCQPGAGPPSPPACRAAQVPTATTGGGCLCSTLTSMHNGLAASAAMPRCMPRCTLPTVRCDVILLAACAGCCIHASMPVAEPVKGSSRKGGLRVRHHSGHGGAQAFAARQAEPISATAFVAHCAKPLVYWPSQPEAPQGRGQQSAQ
jgi:hypothetical protein